ncbi:hypothetical protein FRC11_012927, partial [Ceratobasidium sp. 423]
STRPSVSNLPVRMPRSAHDYVNSLRDKTQADPDTRPDTTEATETDTQVGLFDYPPDDPRSREHVSGRRPRRDTEQIGQYRASRSRDEDRRRRSNDTRARNASLRRTQIEEPTSQVEPTGDEPREPNQLDEEEVRGVAQRGRSCTIHALQHSPSPGFANHGRQQSTQAPSQSQYTYKYETLDHEDLVNCAQEEFGLDVRGYDTQAIIDRIRLATAEQAPQVGSARRSTSIVLLPSTPFRVGGGWSQEVVGDSQPTGPRAKRSSDAAELSDGSSNRHRKHIVVDDDTATEPETEDEPVENEASVRTAARQILAARPTPSTRESPRPPRRGTQAPPPSLEATPSTDLDTQPSTASSHSLGGSLAQYGVSLAPSEGHSSTEGQPPSDDRSTSPKIGKLPRTIAPITGPVHARLRDKLCDKALFATGPHTTDETGDRQPHNTDEVLETDFGSTASTPQPAPQQVPYNPRNYRGHRSHVRSEPEASRHAEPADTGDAADEPAGPSPPNLTPSELLWRERARAIVAKVQEEMAEMAPRRRPLIATASQAPTSRLQSHPAPRGDSASIRRLGGTSCQLDPVSAAHEDILAFNQAVAQGEATSLVQSVTQQCERTAQCAPPESRKADDLPDDDDEVFAQADAYSKQKWPPRSHRVRKLKPLARDVSGLERQVLTMAKIHLFAFALAEGVYQTRATYLEWAGLIHQATSEMELPDHTYKKPPAEILEILVNAVATLRGKVKERLCEFIARVSGFKQTTKNKKLIEQNLIYFNRLYPNSFHCRNIDPRSGDYESAEISHCITLALFHSPNSVRVLYPDYFQEMPLPIVAFALAI